MNRHLKIFFMCFFLVFLLVECEKKGEEPLVSKTDEITKGIIPVEGAELRYVMEGNGTPLVAMGSSLYLPRALSKELRKHFTLICVDTRWLAPKNTLEDISQLTMSMLIDDIEQVRKFIGFDKIAVLGHSAYGLLAFEYARRHPAHVTHIIMHGTAPYEGARLQKASDEYWESHASKERKEIYSDYDLCSVQSSYAYIQYAKPGCSASQIKVYLSCVLSHPKMLGST